MQRIFAHVSSQSWGILVAAIVITAIAISQIVDLQSGKIQLRIDPSIDRLLSQSDERVQFYHKTRRIFGSDENFIVSVKADNLFVHEVFAKIGQLTNSLEALPSVQRVVSITNTPIPESTSDGISMIPAAVPEMQADAAAIEKIRQSFLSDSIYKGDAPVQRWYDHRDHCLDRSADRFILAGKAR